MSGWDFHRVLIIILQERRVRAALFTYSCGLELCLATFGPSYSGKCNPSRRTQDIVMNTDCWPKIHVLNILPTGEFPNFGRQGDIIFENLEKSFGVVIPRSLELINTYLILVLDFLYKTKWLLKITAQLNIFRSLLLRLKAFCYKTVNWT